MPKAIIKFISLFIIFINLYGCGVYGLCVLSDEKYNLKNIQQIKDKGTIRFSIEDKDNNKSISSDVLLNKWGRADKIIKTEAETIWIYKFRRTWKGIMPYFILPIPLALPVGHEKISFKINDTVINSVEITQFAASFVGCGLLPGVHTGCEKDIYKRKINIFEVSVNNNKIYF